MIFLDFYRLIFVIVSFFMLLVLTFLLVDLYKKKKTFYKVIAFPISLAIYSVIVYSIFFISKNHFMAVFFDALFFIGTDWLAFSMFVFAAEYTNLLSRHKKRFYIIFSILCSIDSLLLFVNNFTHHMFDLVIMQSRLGVNYWGNAFKWPHYLHLGMCYVMVILTLLYLLISTVKAASAYKIKYLGILVEYFIVIIVNMISYSLNISLDISVFLYTVLASFCWYFSTYTFPHQLLNQSLRAVNENISDALVCFDIYGHCVYANKVAKSIFQKDGKFNYKKVEEYRNDRLEAMGIGEEPFSIETEDFIVDGKVYHFAVEFQKEYLDNTEVGSCLKLFDKTKEVEDYLREKYAATHDELTGLYNRAGFFEAVDKIVAAEGTKDYLMVASNTKDFKLINELFGEALGDEVLVKQAQLFKEKVPESTAAIYGRISDDKFGLYIKKEYFIEQPIKEGVESLKKLTKSSIYQMHVFVGIYELNGQLESAQSMYDKAIMAIADISNDYTETFAYYDSTLMDKLLNEKNIEKDFQRAIEDEQIEMYLQPIIDIKNKSFGAEALVRWNHPLRGLMLPASFLEILERTGLIYRLDEYIWEQAASKLQQWSEEGITNCYISVNISLRDNYYIDIYKVFTQLVEKYKIQASNLHIEITEDFLMTDFVKYSGLVRKLQEYGFIVVLDKFGIGRSSLNMLKDFDADVLKIDRELLSEAAVDKRSQIILEEILAMTKLLEIDVVGLGVEAREQYDLLIEGDCSKLQGNYISEPLSLQDFENQYIQYSLPPKMN